MHSKLVTMRYQNYALFKDETLVISDNITIMKGLNSNGKSWVLRGIHELFTCPSSRQQKEGIMFGEDKSTLTATFSDGVKIIKEKFQNGRSSYTMLDMNNEEIFSTIVDGEYTPVKAMPEPIKYYIDVPSASTVDLLYRKSRDKLLLVDTSGSENYEFLSTSLNNKELSDAIAFVNRDRLDLRSLVTADSVRFNALSDILGKEQPTPIEILDILEELDKGYSISSEKNDLIESITNLIKEYNSKNDVYITLPNVESSQISEILNLLSLVDKNNSINDFAILPNVKTNNLTDLLGILSLVDKYNQIETTVTLNPMQSFDLEIMNIFQEVKKLSNFVKEQKAFEQESENIKKKQKELADTLAKHGYSITRCKNCDSLTVVDTKNNIDILSHEHSEVSKP